MQNFFHIILKLIKKRIFSNMKDSWITSNIKAILAIIVVILGISYFYMCSIRDIQPNPQILIAMVGSIGTVLGFFFGSSSKAEKSDTTPTVVQTGDQPVNNVTTPTDTDS